MSEVPMEKKTFIAPAITCGHCVANIKRELMDVKGVVSVEGDSDSKKITVGWNKPATWEAIAALLQEIGYPPSDGE